jgi:hypothetical protein
MSGSDVVGLVESDAQVIYAAVFVDHRRKIIVLPIERVLAQDLRLFGRLFEYLYLLECRHSRLLVAVVVVMKNFGNLKNFLSFTN